MTLRPDPAAMADLLVIGGGLHGCATALAAARRGLSVTLLEKDTIARHASGSNAGGLRRLNRHPAELELSHLSMRLWRRIDQITGHDCGFQQAPQIRVAESAEDMNRLEGRAALVRELGYSNEVMLTEREMRAHLPAVAEHCCGALASFDDGFAHPHGTTLAFAQAARRAGVRALEGQAVSDLAWNGSAWHVASGERVYLARRILNAAGAWGGAIAAMIGDHAPVEPIAPMMLVTSRLPAFCKAVVGAAGRPLSFKQMPNGTVVIGGARLGRAEPAHNRTDLRMAELARSAATAAEIFPIMRSAVIVRAWSGIEGRMPDQIPVMGAALSAPNAFHSFGFSAHGFQLGPAAGEVMAALIDTGASPIPLDAFSIARFAQGIPSSPNQGELP